MLQITIKDLDTNKVYLDRKADAIVGGIVDTVETEDAVETTTAVCIYGEGSPQVVLNVINTLNEEVRKIVFGRFLEKYAPLAEVLGINPVELADMLQKDLSESIKD